MNTAVTPRRPGQLGRTAAPMPGAAVTSLRPAWRPARLLCTDLAAETLAGSLPGYAQRGGDPVPAPPVRPGQGDAFGEQRLIPAGALGGLGDRAQIGEVFHL